MFWKTSFMRRRSKFFATLLVSMLIVYTWNPSLMIKTFKKVEPETLKTSWKKGLKPVKEIRFSSAPPAAVPAVEISKPVATKRKPIDFEPKHIWQVCGFFNNSANELDSYRKNIDSFTSTNTGWEHTLLDGQTSADYLNHNYTDTKRLAFFAGIMEPVVQLDFFRYMLMYQEGGLWTDIDTVCHKPIDEWIPETFDAKTINLVVGMELDEPKWANNGKGFSSLFVSPWSILARRRHPVFLRAFDIARTRLEQRVNSTGTTLNKLTFEQADIGIVSGSSVWTAAVQEELTQQLGRDATDADLRGLTKPKQLGDILILPINAFGSGQQHSASGPTSGSDVLVEHQFKGAWVRKDARESSRGRDSMLLWNSTTTSTSDKD